MATKRPTRPRDVDPVDGYVSAASSPYLGSGLMVEAVALFVDEAFGRVPAPQGVHAAFRAISPSGGVHPARRARVLRGHVVLLGERQDVTVVSMSRSTFGEQIARSPGLARVAGPGDGAPGPAPTT